MSLLVRADAGYDTSDFLQKLEELGVKYLVKPPAGSNQNSCWPAYRSARQLLESSEPAVVQACTAQCRVIVSSRRPLFILDSNATVPTIGIERGSKIRNWLRNFNNTLVGTVANCDFNVINQHIHILFSPPEQLSTTIAAQMMLLHAPLHSASQLLKTILE